MTLNNVWDKLRKKNKGNYKQFEFCIGFAVLLISSYLMMLCSPLIQKTLPEGGDSRKQVYLIFGIAIVGCMIFTLYATGLFLRYKSREIGVFLALGAEKGKLSKALFVELTKIVSYCTVTGIVAGGILSVIIGKIFEFMAKEANDNRFSFTASGFLYSLMYCVFVLAIIMIYAVRFMKRSNILDIMNEQRKQEPLKKMVNTRYLVGGVLCLVAGVIGAIIIPRISVNVFEHWLGAWTNAFYLLVVVGLYRIMVYSIACHKKGRNPQKYYKNVISYGMLKFQGGSIVRNMLVITLLIMGGMYAIFYVPTLMIPMQSGFDSYEAKYAYRYPVNSGEITMEEVEALAEEYGIQIQKYREAEFIRVIGSGIISEDLDDNGNLIKEYCENYADYECISASDYERITGNQISVAEGTYYMIQAAAATESVWNRFDDMDKLYCEDIGSYIPMEYAGNTAYRSLLIDNGFTENARYVISDQDYEILRKGLSDENIIRQVLFDTSDNEQEFDFGTKLYQIYALRASEEMKVPTYYDACKKERTEGDYGYDYPAIFDPYNPPKETDWNYLPIIIPIDKGNFVLSYMVYFLLFIYVSVICLAAVTIISYTRSQSVGVSNKQVFMDIEKLGADYKYLRKLLKNQIKKVYVLPTIAGSIIIILYEMMVYVTNDGSISASEIATLPVIFGITACVVIFQVIMYRVSLKKVTELLGLSVK